MLSMVLATTEPSVLVDYDKTIVLATACSVCTLTRTQGPRPQQQIRPSEVLLTVQPSSSHRHLVNQQATSTVPACVRIYAEDTLVEETL